MCAAVVCCIGSSNGWQGHKHKQQRRRRRCDEKPCQHRSVGFGRSGRRFTSGRAAFCPIGRCSAAARHVAASAGGRQAQTLRGRAGNQRRRPRRHFSRPRCRWHEVATGGRLESLRHRESAQRGGSQRPLRSMGTAAGFSTVSWSGGSIARELRGLAVPTTARSWRRLWCCASAARCACIRGSYTR